MTVTASGITDSLRVLIERGAAYEVVASSNVLPDITLYNAADTSPSLFDILGIKTKLTVRRVSDGSVLAEYGDDTRANYILAAGLLTVTAAAAIVLAGVLSPLLRLGR